MDATRFAPSVALPRAWHGLTAATALVALLLQLGLVFSGASVLVETERPDLPVRLARFAAYFTIQSNLLVLVSVLALVRDPRADGRWWRALRLAGVMGITVTGLVHFFLLRPLLELEGASLVADRLLHLAVPALAVVGWVVFGPRGRIDRHATLVAFAWPVVWLVVTLVVGWTTGWYPYPFLDVATSGGADVAIACAGIALLVLVCLAALTWLDRRLDT
ncbi:MULTISPECIES: Pr6Pr family membrane protein [Aeromicrobium]|uniref:Pr6Pr family membrane protein n=1 Tax=Aeromicrobium TaxID=2040 RepID=UPI00257C2842|nr:MULTISPECIES: Pr6Pr family membrane protein [Aeromicrobium]